MKGSQVDPTHTLKLGRCSGDCDSDADCRGTMTCFQRSGKALVPGCKKKDLWDHSLGGGTSNWDYCVEPVPVKKNMWLEIQSESKPALSITSNAAHQVLMATDVTDIKLVTGLYNGDKITDYVSFVDQDGRYIHKSSKGNHLVSSFMMVGASTNWRKSATFRVTHGLSTSPGTLSFNSVASKGYFLEVKSNKLVLSNDYGHNKYSWSLNSKAASFKLVVDAAKSALKKKSIVKTDDHSKTLMTHGVDPSTLLGECKGDCDTDADCKGALACFHRNGLEPITGCTGQGQTSYDYCCKSSFHNGG